MIRKTLESLLIMSSVVQKRRLKFHKVNWTALLKRSRNGSQERCKPFLGKSSCPLWPNAVEEFKGAVLADSGGGEKSTCRRWFLTPVNHAFSIWLGKHTQHIIKVLKMCLWRGTARSGKRDLPSIASRTRRFNFPSFQNILYLVLFKRKSGKIKI